MPDIRLLLLLAACFLLAAAFFAARYFMLRREMRNYARHIRRRAGDGYAEPIKLESFDKGAQELAQALNAQLDRTRRLREENIRCKKELSDAVSGISHDFRTPLTAALGYMQMIERSGELSPQNARYLETAIQKNKYLKELADEFFELNCIEGGEAPVRQTVALGALFAECLMEQYERINALGITPELDIDESVCVQGSEIYLRRILQNLLTNAQKHAQRRFGASLARCGGEARLRVFNDNAGEEIDVARVFEPVYKGAARGGSGTGLGLYVVKRLCERQGYGVSAALAAGGFTVEIVIPLCEG